MKKLFWTLLLVATTSQAADLVSDAEVDLERVVQLRDYFALAPRPTTSWRETFHGPFLHVRPEMNRFLGVALIDLGAAAGISLNLKKSIAQGSLVYREAKTGKLKWLCRLGTGYFLLDLASGVVISSHEHMPLYVGSFPALAAYLTERTIQTGKPSIEDANAQALRDFDQLERSLLRWIPGL